MLKNKILHINCNYTGTTLHQLMIGKLEKLGYKNNVFVPTYNKNNSVIRVNFNVNVCECFYKWDRILFDYKQYKIYRAIQNEYDIKKFNLIHAYTLFTDGNCARKLFKKYNVPYVVAVRNTDVNNFFRLMPHLRFRGIKIMLDAKAIFFLSESYKKQVFEKYVPKKYQKILSKKAYVIPNGIDDFWFQNKPSLKKKDFIKEIKIIYAGRIDRNKNILGIQKALQRLENKGYKVSLTVVGKIIDQKEFEKIKKDKLTTYIPAQPKEKLIELYRKHDIFVMPSFTESFGLVYAEAMSQGLPVIYSKGQGFDGQFVEGVVGYHVDAHDPEELCENIIKILGRYNEFPEACMQASKKFRWNNLLKEYVKIYKNHGE